MVMRLRRVVFTVTAPCPPEFDPRHPVRMGIQQGLRQQIVEGLRNGMLTGPDGRLVVFINPAWTVAFGALEGPATATAEFAVLVED